MTSEKHLPNYSIHIFSLILLFGKKALKTCSKMHLKNFLIEMTQINKKQFLIT